MQLFLNATSPFARLARVAALEKGLSDQLDLQPCDPWSNAPELLALHPQGRIPVLKTDDGHALAESLLIVQWLDLQGDGPRLVPQEAAQVAAVLAVTSVGYGLMEAAFSTVIQRKHEGAPSDATVLGQRRLTAMARALQQLEGFARQTPAPEPAQPVQLDTLCVAIAVEYVQFRLPDILAAQDAPHLRSWLKAVGQRPSLASTAFA